MIALAFSGLLVAIGVAIVVRTIVAGVGGGLGFVIGALFVLAGSLRIYLQKARG
jgi:hypothetical protein